MSKYYFEKSNYYENCYTLDYWIQAVEDEGRDIVLIEAKMVTGDGTFYCSEFGEVGYTGDSDCGIACDYYKPRNGKNGRCKFSKNCYEPKEGGKIKVLEYVS